MMDHRRVLLLIEDGLGYPAGVMGGVAARVREQPNWQVRWQSPYVTAAAADTLRAWKPDGVIARVWSKDHEALIASLSEHVVNVGGSLNTPGMPRITVDDEAVGRMAAEHYLQRGFTKFAFLSERKRYTSALRCRGFRAALEDAGHMCAIYHRDDQQWREGVLMRAIEADDHLTRFVAELPPSIGAYCSDDTLAPQVAAAATRCGKRVPTDIAILGTGNTEVVCNLSNPALSSIALPVDRIGYQAASMLGELMSGKTLDSELMLLAPMGVVARPSTDVIAVNDPEVARALQFIHDHAHEHIRVTDVVRQASLSRRPLEIRFRRCLQRSINDEIQRAHVERAKTLLTTSDMSMTRIAELAGFSSAVHLSVAFRRIVGIPPTEHREQYRLT